MPDDFDTDDLTLRTHQLPLQRVLDHIATQMIDRAKLDARSLLKPRPTEALIEFEQMNPLPENDEYPLTYFHPWRAEVQRRYLAAYTNVINSEGANS